MDERLAELSHAKRIIKDEKIKLRDSASKIELLEQAQLCFQKAANSVQQQAHERIASIVSRCLEAVFDDPYEFQIIFDRKRGKTEARMVFVRDGEEVEAQDAVGGGVLDVASFALRLACLLIHRPPLRRLLVLDEPFKFLSEGHRERVVELVETLAEELGIQFLIITHIRELQIGKVLYLKEEM